MAAVGIVVVAGLVAAGAWFWLESRFNAPGPLADTRDVIIEKGAGTARIAADLAAAGVIGDARLFCWGVKAFAGTAPLRAGEYRFPAAVSAAGAAAVLQSGRTVQRKLTVAEGLSNVEVAALVRAAAGLTGEIGRMPDEGWLLPETYHYAYGDARTEVVRRMRDGMNALVGKLWPGRDPGLPLESENDALILASIVEKETAVAAERPRVARVFINRLKRGMKLQSDPTVAYGITGGAPLERALTRADLEQPTPYNTYSIGGLPPGAIANPGRAAIEAVLHPAPGDELYFVADGSGGHAFAHTLKEHNANVAKWRRLQREQAKPSTKSQ
ncbi:MAG: endolytic transglycosylase MltG [Rhodospirillaceae bacterium]